MPLLVWILIVTQLDPSAPTQPPRSFASADECNAAREAFIKSNMYTNWQGLKMAPLVRTMCTPE